MKSSYCGTNACVDVDIDTEFVYVKDTKDIHQELRFSYEEWREFVKGVKNNEFDV